MVQRNEVMQHCGTDSQRMEETLKIGLDVGQCWVITLKEIFWMLAAMTVPEYAQFTPIFILHFKQGAKFFHPREFDARASLGFFKPYITQKKILVQRQF